MIRQCKSCGETSHNENANFCWKCGSSFNSDKFIGEVYKALENFKKTEISEMKKDRGFGIPVRINPNSMIAKEILYQTILLKKIEHVLEMLNHQQRKMK